MPLSPGGFHHHPELCHFLSKSLNATHPEAAAPQLAAAGLNLDAAAGAAWLDAAIGVTAPTLDPATGQVVDW